MQNVAQPYRSVLYIPGSKTRALEKAQSLPVDAIIFDLEDAVAPDEKVAARQLLAKTLNTTDYGPRKRIVRVNGGDTEWGADDLATFIDVAPDAILLPKVEDPATIAALSGLLKGATTIWAMMETPRGILNASAIAAAPKMEGFVMGTNDLAKDLGSRGRGAMLTSLQLCLLAARAEGLVCVDGVYNAFKDEDGLRAECDEGRDMGFDGKTLIHPAQVAIANEVFGPSEDELDLARRQIEAYEQAKADGQGVAVVDGKIVENLHVETATRLLAKADAIKLVEGA
ncbi:HpcH/HpaI aldolase/citrate lyase family protein [Litoreibacter arenae]|uniref:L-malyl-CoA/beta-methylmalyl-CoA lyase n=1 Tax=Litoreibacter arenae DSM 19593 TaxID=1123360 RepID=S9RU98_9RHOB|nr:CoA ester lyase [Litoreibacter arenae]EPX81585.1 L-malyl-CoA/beta-methylmalyl-CoA lyase [Litoreibacter arenae DSM 19593]